MNLLKNTHLISVAYEHLSVNEFVKVDQDEPADDIFFSFVDVALCLWSDMLFEHCISRV